MKKMRKFLEKPLMIISLSLIAVFFVAVIVMISIPHGKLYKYSYQIDDTTHYYEIILDEKYTEKHYYVLDGYSYEIDDMFKGEYNYEIKNNELYLIDNGSTSQKQKIGEINSRELNIFNRNLNQNGGESVFVCKVNRLLTDIFVVGLFASIVLFVISITMKVISSKKKKEKQDINQDVPQEDVIEEDSFSEYSNNGDFDYLDESESKEIEEKK